MLIACDPTSRFLYLGVLPTLVVAHGSIEVCRSALAVDGRCCCQVFDSQLVGLDAILQSTPAIRREVKFLNHVLPVQGWRNSWHPAVPVQVAPHTLWLQFDCLVAVEDRLRVLSLHPIETRATQVGLTTEKESTETVKIAEATPTCGEQFQQIL